MSTLITVAKNEKIPAPKISEDLKVSALFAGDPVEFTLTVSRGERGGSSGVKIEYAASDAAPQAKLAEGEDASQSTRVQAEEALLSAAVRARSQLPRGGKRVSVQAIDGDASGLVISGALNIMAAQALRLSIAKALKERGDTANRAPQSADAPDIAAAA